MLVVFGDFETLSCPNLGNFFQQLKQFSDLAKYIENVQPKIPCKLEIASSPFKNPIIDIASLNPLQKGSLIYFNRWMKVTVKSSAKKYNILLIDSTHPSQNTEVNNVYYFANDLSFFLKYFSKYFYTEYQNPPQDNQTFLGISIFKYTGKICTVHGDRKIYKNQDKKYYVDHMHSGNGAHIEVFDSLGNHLGQAGIYNHEILSNKKEHKCYD